MTIKFEYGKDDYIYEESSGWIERSLYGGNLTEKVCPVLKEQLTNFDLEGIACADRQKVYILKAILHGYTYGVGKGKKLKAAELRRALDID